MCDVRILEVWRYGDHRNDVMSHGVEGIEVHALIPIHRDKVVVEDEGVNQRPGEEQWLCYEGCIDYWVLWSDIFNI